MQTLFPILLVLLATHGSAQTNQSAVAAHPADDTIPLTPARWTFQAGTVHFLDYKGQRVMQLTRNAGSVVLNDVVFKDGTIEYDVEPIRPESAHSIYFHRRNDQDQEIVYLRINSRANPLANDGIQYCPYVNGVNLWDLYPDYQGPALLKPNQWNHLKLISAGRRLQVFLNQAPQPVLDIPQLEANAQQGSIAFEGAAYIANLHVKPNVVDGVGSSPAPDLTNHDAHYLRTWATTLPQALPDGHELSVRQLPTPDQFTDSIVAERQGLLNLTRKFGANPTRRVVWLQTTLTAHEAVSTNLQLGFSDEVWVFLNHQPVFVDKNLYQYGMRKYPDGRISLQNATVPLPLSPGENDLMIGVANDFYGWGLIARLERTDQLQSIGQISPIRAVARELATLDVSPYEGTYRDADGQLTFSFAKKGKALWLQVPGQTGVALQAVGRHTFLYPSSSTTFKFEPTTQTMTLQEGRSVRELSKV